MSEKNQNKEEKSKRLIPNQIEKQESGNSHIDFSIDLAPGEKIRLTIHASQGEEGIQITRETIEDAVKIDEVQDNYAHSQEKPNSSDQKSITAKIKSLFTDILTQRLPYYPTPFFVFGLLVYLVTRVVGLADFPVWFLSQEAIHSVRAAELAANGLRGIQGEFLPAFLPYDSTNLYGTTVYIHLIIDVLLGISIWSTRFATVLVSFLGCFWTSLTMRDVFKIRLWWLTPYVLAAIPVWFLHSRTGLAGIWMAAFFSGFLYYYLLYRQNQIKMLPVAILFAAFSSYVYPPGQTILLMSLILLLVLDWRYHLNNWRLALLGLGTALLLAIPMVQSIVIKPRLLIDQLTYYNSFLILNYSPTEKLWQFFKNILQNLNLFYWFTPGSLEGFLYSMPGYGMLPIILLPFFLIGFLQMIKLLVKPHYKILLAAFFSTLIGPTLYGNSILVKLSMIIPVVILSLLGMQAASNWLNQQNKLKWVMGSYILGLFFTISALVMMNDALVNGSRWLPYQSSGGMHYGAGQVFTAVESYHMEHPEDDIYISPDWIDQPHILKEFFLPEVDNIHIADIQPFTEQINPTIKQNVFLLPYDDYQNILSNGKLSNQETLKTINYPDGYPAFYLVKLAYTEEAQSIFDEEKEARHRLISGQLTIKEEQAAYRISQLDMGSVENVFDHDPQTLIRTAGANPLVIELDLKAPMKISGIHMEVGAEPVEVTVIVKSDSGEIFTFEESAGLVEDYKKVTVPFNTSILTSSIHIELLDNQAGDPSHVHLWELELQPSS